MKIEPKEEGKAIHDSINDGIRRNEEAFENKITYLGGGAVALSLTYVSTQEILFFKFFLIVGVAALIVSLALNLYSTMYGSHAGYKMFNITPKEQKNKRKEINNCLRKMNRTSCILLMFGILFMSILIIINIYKKPAMKEEHENQTLEPQDNTCDMIHSTYDTTHSTRDIIERGFTYQEPYWESDQGSDNTGSDIQVSADD